MKVQRIDVIVQITNKASIEDFVQQYQASAAHTGCSTKTPAIVLDISHKESS